MRKKQVRPLELEEKNVPKYLKEMEKRCVPSKRERFGVCVVLCAEILLFLVKCLPHIRAWGTERTYESSGNVLLIAGMIVIYTIALWKIQCFMLERERKKIVEAALEVETEDSEKMDSEDIDSQQELLEEEESYCILCGRKQHTIREMTAISIRILQKNMYPICRVLFVGILYLVCFDFIANQGLKHTIVLCFEMILFSIAFPIWWNYLYLLIVYWRRKRKNIEKQILISKESFQVREDKNPGKRTEIQMKDLYVLEYENEILQLRFKKKSILLALDEMKMSDREKLKQVLKSYAGQGYEQRTVQPGVVKWEVPKFVAVMLLAVLLANVAENCYAPSAEQQRANIPLDNDQAAELYEALVDTYGEDVAKQYMKEEEEPQSQAGIMPNGTVVVLVDDIGELKLNLNGTMLYEYYVTQVADASSRFCIGSDGVLYGISPNLNGELGLGDQEERITAKGFYREMEIAEDIIHASMGDRFVAYIDEEKNLWVSGDVPGMGLTIQKTVLTEQVEFVNCSSHAMIILKSDGTVWALGKLEGTTNECIDEAWTTKVAHVQEYPQLTQVMDHARYVAAHNDTFAVIQEDDSLWLWGDNDMQQCGVSNITMPFINEPNKVMEDVRMVWVGEMKVNSYVDYPQPVSHEGYISGRTYIQMQDRNLYVCGNEITGEIFARLKVEQR